MAFERPIDWRSLGVDRDGSTILAACVLPMGFTSSVGIMQHIHRRLALWDPAHGAGLPSLLEVRKDREWPEVTEEAPAWCLYLDDSTILRKVQAEVAIRLAGKPQQEQERLRRAYAFWASLTTVRKPLRNVNALSVWEPFWTERLVALVLR